MSPDRTMITRAEAIRRRKEEEEKQKELATQRNVTKPKPSPEPSSPFRSKSTWSDVPRGMPPVTTNRIRRNYGTAASSPLRQTRRSNASGIPALNFKLPRIGYGPRVLSFLIAVFCLADLFLILNTNTFIVYNADIVGANRINTQEIQNALGVNNQSIVEINPAQVESNILAVFPDISSASVQVNIPNNVTVTVKEREPAVVWQQESGETFWIDSLGYKFQPRGQADNLPVISAKGSPPMPVSKDQEEDTKPQPFLPAELSKTIAALSQILPQGSNLVFDPEYGLGWDDPQGWTVFFGHSDMNNTLKLQVYQSMLDHLAKENIQPLVISVEYPHAPYYRVEE